ncbi:MAG: periplasmic heavy metal sensor, partial [Litoreibacter sp.]|nr:periplasmic heavy metal sensor [Litoreibacter sp.]
MADTPDPVSKPRNWLRILLIASLAVNLLVAGAFVGAAFSDKGGKKERNPAAQMPVGPYGRAFSKEDRQALRQSFEARRDTFRENRAQMRAFGEDLAEAVRAMPFDAEAVRTILTAQRGLQLQMQEAGSEIMVERLEQMGPEA